MGTGGMWSVVKAPLAQPNFDEMLHLTRQGK